MFKPSLRLLRGTSSDLVSHQALGVLGCLWLPSYRGYQFIYSINNDFFEQVCGLNSVPGSVNQTTVNQTAINQMSKSPDLTEHIFYREEWTMNK